MESWTVSFKNKDGSWNSTDVIALIVLAVATVSLVMAMLMMMSQASGP
jgi:hypothetical protein